MNKISVLAQRAAWSPRFELLIISDTSTTHAVGEVIFHELREADGIPNASLQIDYEAAQALMDQLWNCGIRPTEGSGSAGSLLATQNHLADMRKIAFTALKMDGQK